MSQLRKIDTTAFTRRLELRIGGNLSDIACVYDIENELRNRRIYLEGSLCQATDEVPWKLSKAIKKAENNTKEIEMLIEKSEKFKDRVKTFLNKIAPLTQELDTRFSSIKKLQDVLTYLKTFEKVDDISIQLKECTEDDQAVLLYGQLKEMCSTNLKGHQANYVKEYVHYWHNVLKDKYAKHYEELMKQLKWPISAQQDKSPPPKEILTKFGNVTKYLFLIEEPKGDEVISYEYDDELRLCLPVQILLRPLKKRFAFHFTSSRKTARIDRPEWFFTQTLSWVRDHGDFLRKYVQPVADSMFTRRVYVQDQFNAGCIALAAERLHTLLGLYHTQGQKGEMLDVDAAFAHAVDEALGFNRELTALTRRKSNGVLAVLTKAEIFVRWLAVEKKYALAKMDEQLSTEHWTEPVDPAAAAAAAGAGGWLPRGADWFTALLQTIEARYEELPQPGHRLQFLELQLELIEEWRIRLTQILSAGVSALAHEAVPAAAPRPICAVTNAAHHMYTTLLQWANSLHYLHLNYYRQQFEHVTQRHHQDDGKYEEIFEDLPLEWEVPTISFAQIQMELYEEHHKRPTTPPPTFYPQGRGKPRDAAAEGGVFGGAPTLLARLRDAGLTALADHTIMEFKAAARDYVKQKWHAMPVVEEMELSITPSLCRPLAGLCARLHAAESLLAPALFGKLRMHIAKEVDNYLLEELAMQAWWNAGGAQQLKHDVTRNILPALNGPVVLCHSVLPRLTSACTILNMNVENARYFRSLYTRQSETADDDADGEPAEIGRDLGLEDTLRLLAQRTDLADGSASLLELF